MGALLEPFVWILLAVTKIYFTLVLVEVVMHWLIHFKTLDAKNVYVVKIVDFLTKITQPVYKKISEKVPAVSGVDISPFILLLVLMVLVRFLYHLDLMMLS